MSEVTLRSRLLLVVLLSGALLRGLALLVISPLEPPEQLAVLSEVWARIHGTPQPFSVYADSVVQLWRALRTLDPRVVLALVSAFWLVLSLGVGILCYRLTRPTAGGESALLAAATAVALPLTLTFPSELTPVGVVAPLAGMGWFLLAQLSWLAGLPMALGLAALLVADPTVARGTALVPTLLMAGLLPASIAVAQFAGPSSRRVWLVLFLLSAILAGAAGRLWVASADPWRLAYNRNAMAVLRHVSGFSVLARAELEALAASGLHLAHENLATLAMERGEPHVALRHLRAALHHLPAGQDIDTALHRRRLTADYYNSIAVLTAELGWERVARQAVSRAWRLDHDSPAAAFNLGLMLLRSGHPAAAQAHYAALAFRIGHLPHVPLLHAVSAQRAGDCSEALALVPFVQDRPCPPLPPWLTTTGGVTDVALRRQRRIEQLPVYADAAYSTAVCQAQAGQVRNAAVLLRRQLAAGELRPGALADDAWRAVAGGRLPRQVLPNLVVIVVDTLRADHVGVYGYERPTTPGIDRLAAGGVRFANGYSVSSWTGPAIASLFTGLMPAQHGLTAAQSVLRGEVRTLAEELSRLGYRTAAFSANFAHVTPRKGLGRGFDEFQVLQMRSASDDREMRIGGTNLRGATAAELTHAAIEWLRRPAPQPLFLYVHYIDPHSAYHPPARYRDQFVAPDYAGSQTASADDINDLARSGRALPAEDLQHLIDLYDGEIRFADDQIGRLVDHLDGLGFCENCVIVVTSDHGEEFHDHGGYFHGFTLYEEQLRVPLIVYGRGVWGLPPGTVAESVQLTDLFPTLIAMAGGAVPETLHGHTLLPLMKGERKDSPRLQVRAELHPDALIEGHIRPRRHRLAVREHDVKAMLAPDGGKEVYRLDTDPQERINLALAEARLADRLLSVGPEVAPPSSRKRPALSDAHREQLRALGYLP